VLYRLVKLPITLILGDYICFLSKVTAAVSIFLTPVHRGNITRIMRVCISQKAYVTSTVNFLSRLLKDTGRNRGTRGESGSLSEMVQEVVTTH